MMQPKTKYARSGEVHIAYQVVGEGALNLVYVPPFVSYLEGIWEEPSSARYFSRLASFSRLVVFDKRGTGLSDRPAAVPTLEERMDDVRAVMDAAGIERAALFGSSEGGPMCVLFAATYPQRTSALVLYGSYPRVAWAPDYPCGLTAEAQEMYVEMIAQQWGTGVLLNLFAPSAANDQAFTEATAKFERLAASPGAAVAVQRMNFEIDARQFLPAIHVPTLVIYRADEMVAHVEGSRYLAQHIPGAKYVELQGVDYFPWVGDQDAVVDEIQEFLTGIRPPPEPDRVLATILFTDIVASTERVAGLGDRAWRDLVDRHHALVRKELTRFRGREIDTAGDGFLAIFDGPARAIRCACGIRDGVRQLGIEIRAGLHAGEIDLTTAGARGIAVHVGARVMGAARPGEVLVTSTVKDLVAGSGIRFDDGGSHVLKGVPGEWRLFVAT